MTEITRFVVIGLATGGIYTLVAHGLVLVYKGSGLLNFAHGAFAMVGAYAFYEAQTAGLPGPISLGLATLAGALVAGASQLLVLGPMHGASPLSRVIATLGLLSTLQAAATLRYGVDARPVASALPTGPIEVLPDVSIGRDRLIILAVGVICTIVLHLVYRHTAFGRATAAVAENPLAASTLGHSPNAIALGNWLVAGALAGLAGALLAPISFVQANQFVLLIVPALAAGLLARFSSFPLALAGCALVGVAESLTARYVRTPGWSGSIAFLLVLIVILVRPAGLPLRSHVQERLPDVGAGIHKLPAVIGLYLLGAAAITWWFPVNWVDATSVTLVYVLLCLSVVVVTGYGGQLSLAQFVFAGVAALAAAKLYAEANWSFPLAAAGGVVIAVAIGVAVAIPTVRIRGVTLAVATFGFGVVLFNLVLNNGDLSNHSNGVAVSGAELFGLDLDAIAHPERFATLVLSVVAAVSIAVVNVRRGASGRRMLAVRSNERAAASLGVNVYAARLYAFTLGVAIAAVAGVLLAFRSSVVLPEHFAVLPSVSIVAAAVVGGVGMVGGAFLGALLLPEGVVAEALRSQSGLDRYLPLVGGIAVLVVLRNHQTGLYRMYRDPLIRLWRKIVPARARSSESGPVEPTPVTVREAGLVIEGLTVRFGGVAALDAVDFDVRPGEVHGLIGPNGAGKTTFVDAVTGFVRPDGGAVRVGFVDVSRRSPAGRSRAGLTRSFQSVELFSSLTVRESLSLAGEDGSLVRYATDLVAPAAATLGPAAWRAVADLGLEGLLDADVAQLTYGQRKLVAVARALSCAPSILLLDEPAAGLDDHESAELAATIRMVARTWSTAVVLIEHNVSVVLAACDRLTVLVAGAVIATGAPSDVVADPVVIDAYLGAPSAAGEGAEGSEA
jgi:ABC-type branched-subunit amino acid transport system ATPase component/branched-subunit amino acid ABC-type transport system permease component